MTTPIRWGVIGTGGIARTFARDLRFIDDGVVVAVGSRTRAAAENYGAEFGVTRCYASYEGVAADPEVDAVYVATPHPLHHDNAMLALEHGKPVLVEKAFTMNGAEARDLVDAARSRGVFMMEAMWTRFLPHVVAIRDVLGRGVLGEVVCVIADHGKWFEKNPKFRLFAPALGGGALLDLGVYPVSFASMILGTPRRMTAMVEPTFTGVDGLTSMIFGYDSGAQAILTCTSSARSATRASVVGTDARLDIEGDFYAPTSFSVVPRATQVPQRFEFVTEGRGLHYEALEVARCLRAGLQESPVMPLDETVSIMETMDRVLGYLAAPEPK